MRGAERKTSRVGISACRAGPLKGNDGFGAAARYRTGVGLRESMPVVDGLLAATARVHDLTLVARNVKNAVRTGVDVLDPFTPTAP
jgi:predicted nucleic acid-binding protein